MGQFSWFTQDTNEAIRERYGCSDKQLTTAYLHDNVGNVWEETNYEGYGVFGEKDFYALLAEMNAPDRVTMTPEHARDIGLDIAFSGGNYLSPNLTRHREWVWVDESPEDDPNQGWGEYEEEE